MIHRLEHGGVRAAVVMAVLLTACSPTIDLPAPAELTATAAGSGNLELAWSLVVRVEGYELHYSTDGSGPPYTGSGLRLAPVAGRCQSPDLGVSRATLTRDGGPADRGPAVDRSPRDRAAPKPDGSSPDAGSPDQSVPDAGSSDRSVRDAGSPERGLTGDAAARDRGPTDTGADGSSGRTGRSPILLSSRSCMDVENSFTEAGMVPVSTPGKRPRVRLTGLVPGQTYAFSLRAYRGPTRSAFGPKVTYVAK